ncbi:MAG TPA: transporter [Burkholderiales bacterium]|nr:transporter [Burkholderiales bacterium]
MKYLGTLALAIWAVLSAAAYANQPLVTDDTFTQGPGRYQLEVEGETSRDRQNGGPTAEETGVTMKFTYGATDPLDLFVTVPYFRVSEDRTHEGLADVSLGAKWRFFERGANSLGLKPEIAFATGEEQHGLGGDATTYSLTFLVTRGVPLLVLLFNLGYDYRDFHGREERDAERRSLWRVSTGGWLNVAERWRLVADLGIERNSERGGSSDPAFALAGIVYSPNKDLDFDLGYKHAINDTETDRTILLGVTWRF